MNPFCQSTIHGTLRIENAINKTKMPYRPIVLVVLDGWGLSNNVAGNPIREAKLPTFDKLNRFYPMTTLQASGISVGLPWNTSGNSEVGHMTMGAGRVIYQNLPRIALSIQDGTFYKNETMLAAINHVKEKGSHLHVMGLVSSGAVHSHREHLAAILRMAKQEGITQVFIHAFTDGRDSPPTSGIQHIKELDRETKLIGIGTIASLSGRNFSMDRNNNWDRIEKSYRMLTEGKAAETVEDPLMALEKSYSKGITDEFVEPTIIASSKQPFVPIKDDDAIIFFNFREDRARELTKAFVEREFDGFDREYLSTFFVTMTEYERNLPVHIAFAPEEVKNSLGETLSQANKKQLRIAETEKYAHVTYFFNGGKEKPFPGEDRMLIPSPTVSHFDEVPEMSAPQVTERLIETLEQDVYDFILVNYANADMVGHTGNEEATIIACQAADKSLSLLIPAILKRGGAMFITADHGNAEELKNLETGEIDTEHSTNPIPLWFVAADNHREKSADEMVREQNEVRGLLSDVAPTILEVMGVKKPDEMNGASLLKILQ